MLWEGAAAVAAEPSRKDVVVAVLGASAALGGFVLVFLGLSINAYQAYPGDTPKAVLIKRRRSAWAVLGVFPICIGAIAAALIWLAAPGGVCFYRVVVGLFAAELAAIVAVAIYTASRVLR